MGKNSWIALLLALVVLVTTVPVCAAGAENPGVQAYREDDYGGLAPDPVRPPSTPGGTSGGAGRRSEERRVGKEC